MVLAALHAITGFTIAKLSQKKLNLSNLTLYLAAFGAIIPDFDFILALIFQDMTWHRAFTHHIAVPIIFFILAYFPLRKYKKELIFFNIGYLSHIILDTLATGTSMLNLAILDGIAIIIFITITISNEIYKEIKQESTHA